MRLKEWVYDSIGWLFCELGCERDLKARIQQLEGALEPFAKEAHFWRDIPGVVKTHDDVELWQRPNHRTKLTVGDLRRAAACRAQAPSDALVERVARAVWEEMDCPQPCERLEGCSCATDAARAALAALRPDGQTGGK